jgi:nucleoid-associated protein YgaU
MSEPEFDDQPYHGTQILWGRVVVLLLALALAFWLGTTFGGDATAQAELEQRLAEISQLESEVAALEAQVAAASAGGSDAAGEGSSGEGASGEDETKPADDAAAGRGQSSETGDTDANANSSEYVVQSGDSLAAIAQEVYGDPTLWREIAEANDLSPPYSLTVGDTLEIPPQP